MAEAVVAAAELGEALGRVAGLASSAAQEVAGTWKLGQGMIRLAWGGMVRTLEAEVAGQACVRVAGAAMAAIAGTCERDGDVTVSVASGRLTVGSFAVPCWDATPGVLDLAPVDASPGDALLAAYRVGGGELDAAGLEGLAGPVADRARESVREAAETLAWMGVDEAAIAAWLDDRLAREATRGRGAKSGHTPSVRVLLRDR